MNVKAISRNVGYALLVSALFMFLSVIVSMASGNDSALAALSISFVITFIVGVFPFIFVRKTTAITLKDGYMIITLAWLLSFIFGMLPYAMWSGPFSLVNAWFESVSGFTTTGSTILDNVEALPRSLLFWRASTHFIGGLGVVVFLLLIIPNDTQMRMRLSNMELSSMIREGYSLRANKSVYIFAIVYIVLAVAAFVAYLIAGMAPFDAICHAFSVCATGGFSTRAASIGAFDSRAVEIVTLVFMLLSSIHFGQLYISVATRSLRPLRNPVVKTYLASIAVITVLVFVIFRVAGNGVTLWQSLFQTVCVTSTSGFAVVDNASWPLSANAILLLAAIVCGCSGSTSGGIKCDRFLLILKSVGRQMGSILHPSAVNEIRLGDRMLKDEDVAPQLLYVELYFLVLAVSVVLSIMCGVNGTESLAASITSLSNVGSAFGDLGTMASYNSIPTMAKLVCTLDMFLGRVEIYPLLAVCGLIFARKSGK